MLPVDEALDFVVQIKTVSLVAFLNALFMI